MITRVSLGSQGSRNHNNNVCLTFHVASGDFQDSLNMMRMRANMPSADKLHKQFGSRSGPTERRSA